MFVNLILMIPMVIWLVVAIVILALCTTKVKYTIVLGVIDSLIFYNTIWLNPWSIIYDGIMGTLEGAYSIIVDLFPTLPWALGVFELGFRPTGFVIFWSLMIIIAFTRQETRKQCLKQNNVLNRVAEIEKECLSSDSYILNVRKSFGRYIYIYAKDGDLSFYKFDYPTLTLIDTKYLKKDIKDVKIDKNTNKDNNIEYTLSIILKDNTEQVLGVFDKNSYNSIINLKNAILRKK